MENYVTSTGYLLYKKDLTYEGIMRLKSALSTVDLRTNNEVPKGFFELGNDYIGIPRIPKKTLERIVGKSLKFRVVREVPEVLNPVAFRMDLEPLEHQRNIIKEATEYLLAPENPFEGYGKRLSINLLAGMGKTYIAANIISKLKCKFLFLVNSFEVAKQAHREFTKFLKPRKGAFLLVTRGLEMKYPDENTQGIFMTHAMFRSIIETFGLDHVRTTLINDLKMGVKILDEFDMEVSNMYFIDVMFNFKYNLYLTATQYKSLIDDDRVYQLIYSSMKVLGRDVEVEPRKDIFLIKFKSSPSPGEFYKITQREDMFKIMYNNVLGLKDIQFDYIMREFYLKEDSLFKKIFNEEGQVGFFCGRIDTCDVIKEKLIKRYNIPEEDIGILNTKVSGDAARRDAKEKPWLITITQSFGRGVDSPILRCLVYLEFTFSLSQIVQSVSRVGRIGKKYGYVIYPVDFSFSKVINSYEKLKKLGFFKKHFKNISFKTIPENDPDYIYGYRKDSDLGRTMMKRAKERNDRKAKLSRLLSN